VKFTLHGLLRHPYGSTRELRLGSSAIVGEIWWSDRHREWTGFDRVSGRNVSAKRMTECRSLLEQSITQSLQRAIDDHTKWMQR